VGPATSSNAILIDPTAPETVAALAGALDDSWSPDDVFVDDHEGVWRPLAERAVPAFVARLRGKP
jgi:hypothetical protein